jgi:type IV secretion system protein VirB11
MKSIGEMSCSQAENILCTVASLLGTVATRDRPIVEGELFLDGSRFEGLLPPVVEAPAFTIRKRAFLIYSLNDYVRDGIMTESDAIFLKSSVKQKQNILVVGATGSGKTTFCNALLREIATSDSDSRIVLIEDTRELQCSIKNQLSLKTSDSVTITQLLRACMRLRPDRIVVGEVRGPEALALVKAWNTGHPGGVTTIHANNATAGLLRVEQLMQEANVPVIREVIAEVINIIVSIQRGHNKRTVEEIVSVHGYDTVTKQYLITNERGVSA